MVHNDVLYLLGGGVRAVDGSATCLNDVWVYADVQGLADYYLTANTPSPQLAKGESYQPYWIEVTRSHQKPYALITWLSALSTLL